MFARPSSLLVVLLASTLVLAVPIPVGEGDVVLVKPKHFEPKPDGSGNLGRHPAVVVSNPNDANKVKIAVVSNNQPAGTITKPGSDYGLSSGHINVGPPKVADVANVKPATQDPKKITDENLAKLKKNINENCSDGNLVRRDGSSCKRRAKPVANRKTPTKPPAKPPVKPPAKPPAKPPVKPPVKPPARPAARPAVKPPVKPPAKPPVKVRAANKARGTKKR